jgi:hypothetical protein
LSLGFLVPGVREQRLPVPFLEHEPDVDILLQASDAQLLTSGGHQHVNGRHRGAGPVRADFGVVDAEHAAIREDRHDEL